jgi:hypothetical protein
VMGLCCPEQSGTRESNAVSPDPKSGGSAISLAPDMARPTARKARRPELRMPSTVEFSTINAAGIAEAAHGWQESNHP